MPHLLLALALVAADASPVFRDSPLGFDLFGKGVVPLDERWVTNFSSEPLLMRVERRGDTGCVALYAVTGLAQADAGPIFAERAHYDTCVAPEFDSVVPVDLGADGPGFAIQLHEDVPDDGRSQVIVVGRGPHLLLDANYPNAEETPATLRLGARPPVFSIHVQDHAPVVTLVHDPKILRFTTPHGDEDVELGYSETEYVLRKGAFVASETRYRDLLPSLALHAPDAPKLVDGKLDTGAVVHAGKAVRVELGAAAHVRMLRLVIRCADSKRGAASKVQLTLGKGEPFEVQVGQPVTGTQVAASGLFDMGPGGGQQELLVFDPPIACDKLVVSLLKGDGPGGSACLSELSLHGMPDTAPK